MLTILAVVNVRGMRNSVHQCAFPGRRDKDFTRWCSYTNTC